MKLRILQQKVAKEQSYPYDNEEGEHNMIYNKPILQTEVNGVWEDIPIVTEWVDWEEKFHKPKETQIAGDWEEAYYEEVDRMRKLEQRNKYRNIPKTNLL